MPTLQPVYISGTGHCSARGLSPASAATSVLAGETAHEWRKTAGQRYPYFRMPLQGTWLQRAEAAMHACVAGIRNRLSDAIWQQLPVFFASSSFQVGQHEAPLATASAEMASANTAADLQTQTLPFPPGAGSFARQCAQWLGLQAVPQCFSHACTSSSLALDAAASWLAYGWASHALVIATEYENQLTGNGFHSLGLLSPDACRPFAVNRSGFVLGEAVAAVLLSTDRTFAGARADIAWHLSACASGTDTYSLTGPDPEGQPIAVVIAAALQRAQLQASDIGLVKLHAAGVDNTDMAEARALRHVFGDRLPPLLSLKPYLGHTLGASTLAEITALLACLDQGQIPATPGCERPDPALGMQPAQVRQPCAARHVLLINLGFGGSITASILSRRGA